MTDKPILFSAPMIRALIGGQKTQTRRIVVARSETSLSSEMQEDLEIQDLLFGCEGHWIVLERPLRFSVGDRLWVRETLRFDWTGVVQGAWRYDADREFVQSVCKRTLETPTPNRWPLGVCVSIHMPHWASRLTLTVTDVRVQRLQEISEEDAIAEGVEEVESWPGRKRYRHYSCAEICVPDSARISFSTLWDSINGDRAWEANPWIVALTFTVHRCNIDALAALQDLSP